MTKKVLIVYATGGMGHVSAAKAIEQAFKNNHAEVRTLNVDVIDYSTEVYRKFFVDGYNYISSKKPKVWGKLYHWFNKKSAQTIPTMLSKIAIESRFIPFVKEFNPDFIVSTHPLPMVLVSASKRKEVIDIMSSMVVTDFGCHSFWVDDQVNYYFVATDEVKTGLVNYGVPAEKVVVTGIPIQTKFSAPVDKKSLIKSLGLKDDLFTFLIVGGQFSLGDLQTVITDIKAKTDKIQFIVVAGRDQYLKEELDKSNLKDLSEVKILGFIDNMHEIMSVSDLIFTKAGGLTVSECLAKGLPMVINKVIPGQEEDNVNYLVNQGAAVKVNNNTEIAQAVIELVVQPAKLNEMKKACQKVGKPDSALNLADFIYKKI
ncbi:MAG: glycosyltransferase [Candidatus Buchananbacteria bacterium]|nr:glycosyltransferase [Candidatus Buchananbacteria bacterium]